MASRRSSLSWGEKKKEKAKTNVPRPLAPFHSQPLDTFDSEVLVVELSLRHRKETTVGSQLWVPNRASRCNDDASFEEARKLTAVLEPYL